ncbi:cytochrome c [Glaciimonas sp. CA11.2]|uniref:c-type cytochrome n=2 Tax=Pseudomonadota TaxID=1224 RepID=UPI002AB484E1|nr:MULTISPECIES: cytochrome c [unclassified Glaciimonas]MDY7545704.1 cytochrome c [Glaciimonas sp. CA11.2]MEB0011648.1 cytochrome c [Glaciimonas sp. Cout2]MEB0081445.1 cytochrome c [Glaciimonas sp. Gout2]MEB0163886.1 cytochrome c [Glaciimonas sp. CA11.2]
MTIRTIQVALHSAFYAASHAVVQVTIVGVVLAGAVGTASAADAPPYTVVNGNQVDSNTLKGWHTWRAMACERCHGANQQGLVGPALVDSLKTMTKEDFKTTVLLGRMEKGMPNFNGSKQVVDNIDNLYAFLKGRSDGAINTGSLKEIPK